MIHHKLMQLEENQLQTFFGISKKLASQVYTMFHQQHLLKAAIGYYHGEAFRHLDAASWTTSTKNNADDALRILSAMYGILRPMDGILPYRMDMTVNFDDLGMQDGYSFWSERVTNALCDQLEKGEVVFNLASKEFAMLIDKHAIHRVGHWVDVDFLTYKDGSYKTIAMTAKKARGTFAKILLETPIDSIKDVRRIPSFHGFELLSDQATHHLRYVIKT